MSKFYVVNNYGKQSESFNTFESAQAYADSENAYWQDGSFYWVIQGV